MVKQFGKKKKKKNRVGEKSSNPNVKPSKITEISPKAYDEDTAVFILISQELKDEGNKLFQKRELEGAMFKYEKALKLLPANHIDVSYLRTNMAACYMEMGLSEYTRAIHECNLALEVTPKYTKALLKRARCYEALNELQFAQRDVATVLKMEPNNLMAKEIANRLKSTFEKKSEALSELQLAQSDVSTVLEMEPNNLMAKDIANRLKSTVEKKGLKASDLESDMVLVSEFIEPPHALPTTKEKPQNKSNGEKEKIIDNNVKKKGGHTKDELEEKAAQDKFVVGEKAADAMIEGKKIEDRLVVEENKAVERLEKKKTEDVLVMEEKKIEDRFEEKKIEDKLVVREKISDGTEEEPKRTLKLVYGEDIRWAQVPIGCSILTLREIICDRFPSSKAVLVKYRDHEGDLVTITSNEELKWAEAAVEQQGSLRLYVVDVSPEQDPLFEKVKSEEQAHVYHTKQEKTTANGVVRQVKGTEDRQPYIDEWIIQFVQLFKNYVGISSDAYLDLHEFGMKMYTEAMEETVTSEDAQGIFDVASDKFQEMASLALFNWGNVHMSRARKKVYFTENDPKESVLVYVRNAYDWAQEEYSKAGKRYEEALKIKPDFYEGIVALGQQQFERAKLSWYYAAATNVDLDIWPSTDVIQLYNCAEDNMEKGMQMFEEVEQKRVNDPSTEKKLSDLDGLTKDITIVETAELAANMRSQINILWGTMLYERSIMEYKLGLPIWQESLEVAVEKFELAGAAPTDLAVMIKNHCSSDTALEGLGFNIDEIIQAWNEMYEAKKLQTWVPSFRLEPLLRRRVSNIYHVLESS